MSRRALRALALVLVCVGIALVPSTWWGAAIAAVVAALTSLVSREGVVSVARRLVRLRWIVVFTLVPQLVFLPFEAACANSTRVIAAILVAELISAAVPVSELIDGVERALHPFRRWIDPERAALMVALTITTIPVLARLAQSIREAHIARGVRPRLHRLVVPLLVAALKHADELSDALIARGFGASRELEPSTR